MFKKLKKYFFVFKLRIYRNYNFFVFKKSMNEPNLQRKKIYPLPENVFLNLLFEDRYSMNWDMRQRHLELITNQKRNKKIKEIVQYFKSKKNYEKSLLKIVETNNKGLYKEPISHNKNFWDKGNNYFIYPIVFGFKKDVVAYQDANKYIKNNKLNLFSKEYFESLDDMSDKEIQNFLKANPIEITNNCITSGKHRACAMIGRLINEKKYIPIYALIG